MKDPSNQNLIDEYMAWEKENAIKQIAGIESLRKANKN